MKRTIAPIIAGLFTAALGGCGHYMVRAPDTGRTFYTRHINRSLGTKAITFKDVDTGAKVTLMESEITRLTPQEFEQRVDVHAEADALMPAEQRSASR